MLSIAALRRTIDRAGDCAGRLPASLGRRARWPLALGALLLAASTASVLATTNSPPEIVSATVSPQVLEEGQDAVLSVTFTDPDPGDYHTVRLRWRDDYARGRTVQVFELQPGQTSIQVPHTFKDTPLDDVVRVTVFDRQAPDDAPLNDNTEGAGVDVALVPITVKNVAPRLAGGGVSVSQPERRKVVVTGVIVDPGADDTWTVEANWGLGPGSAPTPCTFEWDGRRFYCEHTYTGAWGVPRTYHIGVRILDDDGGLATYQTSARVQ